MSGLVGLVDVDPASRPLHRASLLERRRFVVDRAAQLFELKGFDATPMQDIADAVGLTKPALYHYFRSKQEILYEIHNIFIEDMLGKATAFVAESDDCRDQLRFFVSNIIDTVARFRPYVRVFFQEMNALDEEHRTDIRAKRKRYELMVQACLERGVATGVFRSSLDPRLGSLFLFGACNWTYQWLKPGDDQDVGVLTGVFYDLLMSGFALDAPGP
jgi:AcrR family transcriptional regulator